MVRSISNAPRPAAIIVCTLIALIAFVLVRTIESAADERQRIEQRSQVLQQASTIRARLEAALTGELLLTRGLVAEIERNPAITDQRLREITADLMVATRHIRNIGFARGLVLSFVHPLEGNEAAIGLKYDDNPAQWPAVRRAIETRKTIVAGPLQLVQGGMGIVSRTPIFAPRDVPPEEQSLVGMVSTVMNLTSVLEHSGVLETADLTFALRGRDGQGALGDLFHGVAALFDEDPVLLDVSLPEGTWQLAAKPAAGWVNAWPMRTWLRAGATAVALFMMLATALIALEFERRKKLEVEQTRLIGELRSALEEVRTLSELLPICAGCKKIRDDGGYWQQIEDYLHTHQNLKFSHGICPDCTERMYGDLKENS